MVEARSTFLSDLNLRRRPNLSASIEAIEATLKKDLSSITEAEQLLADDSLQIVSKQALVIALGRIKGTKAESLIIRVLGSDANYGVRQSALNSLTQDSGSGPPCRISNDSPVIMATGTLVRHLDLIEALVNAEAGRDRGVAGVALDILSRMEVSPPVAVRIVKVIRSAEDRGFRIEHIQAEEVLAKQLYEEGYELIIKKRDPAGAARTYRELLDKYGHTRYMNTKVPPSNKTRKEIIEGN